MTERGRWGHALTPHWDADGVITFCDPCGQTETTEDKPMTDLQDRIDTTPTVIHEDGEQEHREKFPDESRWRITVGPNDEPVIDRESPPCRVVWETQYLGDDGKWHAGTPSWATWLRLLPKVHQAGLVSGRRSGIDETKVKTEKRGRPHAALLRDIADHLLEDSPFVDSEAWAEILQDAANMLSPEAEDSSAERQDVSVTPDPVRIKVDQSQ